MKCNQEILGSNDNIYIYIYYIKEFHFIIIFLMKMSIIILFYYLIFEVKQIKHKTINTVILIRLIFLKVDLKL